MHSIKSQLYSPILIISLSRKPKLLSIWPFTDIICRITRTAAAHCTVPTISACVRVRLRRVARGTCCERLSVTNRPCGRLGGVPSPSVGPHWSRSYTLHLRAAGQPIRSGHPPPLWQSILLAFSRLRGCIFQRRLICDRRRMHWRCSVGKRATD